MSEAIGPGDFVECAPVAGYKGQIASDLVKCSGEYPRPARIYQVREVGSYGSPPRDGVRLVGIVASYEGHPDCWWEARCFRPIYRPKQTIIEALKAPPKRAPKRQREDA